MKLQLWIEKKNIEIENIEHEQSYWNQLTITSIISLNNLKLNIKRKDNSTIFKIDDEIINADYRNYLSMRNIFLRIIVEKSEKKWKSECKYYQLDNKKHQKT
jgi:hypothetical protein